MKSIGYFINGKEVPGKSNSSGEVFNPSTGEKATVAYATRDELDEAVELAASSAQMG